MDPVFGMVAVRDSKAMDAARQKNSAYEKDLKRRIARLENECYSNMSKINSNADELCQLLQDPMAPDRQVVFPNGLSSSQKEAYKALRRTSVQSMTLEQFDDRLSEVRKSRELERKASQPSVWEINVQKRSRKHSDTVLNDNALRVSSEPKIVQEPSLPTTRRRSSIMKDAFQRALLTLDKTESDVLKLPAIQTSTSNVEFEKAKRKKGQVSSVLVDSCERSARGSPSPIRRKHSVIQKLLPDGPLDDTRKTTGNSRQRGSLSAISGLDTFRQKRGMGGFLEDGETTLSRLNNIIEAWSSSSAAKPTCATPNLIQRP